MNVWNVEVCDCGHDDRQHALSLSPFMPRFCSVADCDCSDFRPVGQDKPDGDAA